MLTKAHLKLIIKSLPTSPGVYQYLDAKGIIIYIGKAKNLKKRVSSYFTKQLDQGKTQLLVSKIATIQTIVVETEYDALLLENNLIKKFKPRYNILLKDDKTYPWICIKKEAFPRVFPTRKLIKDGSEYFGPYASIKVMYALLDLIKELYPIRTCNLILTPQSIEKKHFKLCLEYHIRNCMGPCEAYQSQDEYQEIIQAVRNLLKGNFVESKAYMVSQMQQYAAELKFEVAQKIKEKIAVFENYQARSTVVSPTITQLDVFSIISDAEQAFVNFLSINNGAIIQSHTEEYYKKLAESDIEILQQAIIDFRTRFDLLSREIIVSQPLDINIPGVKFNVPQQGEKRKLIELSIRNANYYRIEQLKQIKIIDPERHTKRILEQMQKDLHLPTQPIHIECFDNSNIQGTNPVSACVVFKNAKASKKDYRHFKVKTVEGPNDFATMEEVIYRRYSRLLETHESLPQLIIIDGGKGQLHAALKSIEKLGLRNKISLIGIAKRLEEIYFLDDPYPLYLDKTSETLKIIQQARDEAHRFGITFHRKLRSKNNLKSELDQVKGIGRKTKECLFQEFKSLKRIKEAPQEKISALIGVHKAQLLTDFFKNKNLD